LTYECFIVVCIWLCVHRSGPLLFTVAGFEITATVGFTLVCFPVFVLKQLISIVQLFSACHTIVSTDELEIMRNKAK
jgi:hypothetical protein